MSSAVQNALQAATAAVSLAAMRLRSKFGMAIAAIMAIMATTIINSISVKPLLFITHSPCVAAAYKGSGDWFVSSLKPNHFGFVILFALGAMSMPIDFYAIVWRNYRL